MPQFPGFYSFPYYPYYPQNVIFQPGYQSVIPVINPVNPSQASEEVSENATNVPDRIPLPVPFLYGGYVMPVLSGEQTEGRRRGPV